MLQRFKTFDRTQAAANAMERNEQAIVDVNREQLYEFGIGADNKSLAPYSAAYARKKLKQRGKSIVDIYATGALQNNMKLTVNGITFTISSTVPYSPYVEMQRPNVYGLTDLGLIETWSIIQPDFVRQLKEHTGTL
jgi:hypothetical protein